MSVSLILIVTDFHTDLLKTTLFIHHEPLYTSAIYYVSSVRFLPMLCKQTVIYNLLLRQAPIVK